MADCIPLMTIEPRSGLNHHGNATTTEAVDSSNFNGTLRYLEATTLAMLESFSTELAGASHNWTENVWKGDISISDVSQQTINFGGQTVTSSADRVLTEGRSSFAKNMEEFLNSRVIVFICVFGVIGNILNLIVLTRKGLQKTMDRMEKSAHYGLVALAVSDTLFCLAVLPHVWVDKTKFIFTSRSFDLYYVTYEAGIINTMIMSSTWLTVAMATSRYFAICHPLRAREIIGMTFAKVSLIVVFLLCVVFNLPRFFVAKVDTMPCMGGWMAYFINSGFLKLHPKLEFGYLCVYSLVGILVPLILLAFCNVNLIRALRQSVAMRQQYKNNQKTATKDSKHHITLTLVIIVIAYFLLVLPAEIVNLWRQFLTAENTTNMSSFNVAVAIVNTLQAVNFSFNFVLYCVVNVHFRRVIKNMLCYWCLRSKRLSRTYSSVASAGSYVTRRTTCTDFELSTY